MDSCFLSGVFSVYRKPGPIKHKPKGKHTKSVLRGPVAFSSVVGEGFQAWNLETLSNYKNCIAGEMKRILASQWLGGRGPESSKLQACFSARDPAKLSAYQQGRVTAGDGGPAATPTGKGKVALSQVSHSPVRYEKGTESIHLKEVFVLKDQRGSFHGNLRKRSCCLFKGIKH